jgi:hypothetical protein
MPASREKKPRFFGGAGRGGPLKKPHGTTAEQCQQLHGPVPKV